MDIQYTIPNYVTSTGVASHPGIPRWTNNQPVPKLDQKITVKMNGIGPGVVRGYVVQKGETASFVGLWVEVTNPPEWYAKQGAPKFAVFFGTEVDCAA